MKIWIGLPLPTVYGDAASPGISAQVTKPTGELTESPTGLIDVARGKCWAQVELEGIDERLGKGAAYEDRRKFTKGHTASRPPLSRGLSARRSASSVWESTIWVCCPNCKRGVEVVKEVMDKKLVCGNCKHFFSVDENCWVKK